MTNEEIVKIVCDIKNLSIDESFPINECGERTDKDFDKRFVLDRTYQHEFFKFKRRIRFVIYYNQNYVTVFINNFFISSISKSIDGKKVYDSHRIESVSLHEINTLYEIINRNNKIKKIKERQ